ncbi:MAG: hypothetical protein AAF670_04400 [Planctomycetota bacterium]
MSLLPSARTVGFVGSCALILVTSGRVTADEPAAASRSLRSWLQYGSEVEFTLTDVKDDETDPFQDETDKASTASGTAPAESKTKAADGESTSKLRGVASLAMLPSVRGISVNQPLSPGILPKNYAAAALESQEAIFHGRGHQRAANPETLVLWDAPWVAYRPLYFEDVWLERHGYDHGCCQTLFSAAHFFGRIPVLPYMKGASPCGECTYSLGLGRPGDCPPQFCTLPKKSPLGLLYQTAFVSGTTLLAP